MKVMFWGVLLAFAAVLPAQHDLRGHWSGNIEVPNQALGIEVDIDRSGSGWIGAISIPAQGTSGLPLEAITFSDGKASFRIKGVPGEPTFNGSLSEDGKSLAGQFTQGGGTFAFKLSRTGEPKLEAPARSPDVAKEFVGTWEGTLDAGGQMLRVVFKLWNDDDGAKAVLVSLDQGGSETPVSSIEQKDANLVLNVRAISGAYRGVLNKEGTELHGTWTQGGNELPLKLTKKGAQAAKP